MIRKPLSLLVVIFTLLAITTSFSVNAQQDELPSAVLKYDAHRQAYNNAKEQEQLRYESELSKASATKFKTDQEIEALRQEKRRIQAEIDNRSGLQYTLQSIRNGILFVVYPIITVSVGTMSLFGFSGSFDESINQALPIAFGVWAIMLFLFFKGSPQKAKTNKKSRWASLVFLLALLLMAPALFAQEVLSNEQKLKNSLELTSKLFSMSEYERYLEILEMEDLNNVLLPSLESGSEFLKVYRKVDTRTGKAYFTIAALATKLGRNGKAIDALKQLNRSGLKINIAEHDYIITQALKFLIDQNQPKAASDLLDSRLPKLTDSSKLISLSEYLTEKGFLASAEKTIAQAISNAQSTYDLIRLGDFLYSINKQTEAKIAFDKALKKASSPEHFVQIADAWSRNSITVPNSILTQLTSKYSVITANGKSRLDFQLSLIDVVYKNQKNENAIQLFSVVLKEQKGANESAYRQLIDYALSNIWYEQATESVQSLVRKLPDRKFEVRIRPNRHLSSEQGLPNKKELSLPVLYGLLNEEQQLNDNAIQSYIYSIQHSLNEIQASRGYDLDYSLNDFYLLGRQYKASNNFDMLAALDGAYTLLEEQSLADQKLVNEDKIKIRLKSVTSKQYQIGELEQEIELLKKRHQDKILDIRLQTLSLIGSILFLLALLITCIVWARNYALKQSTHRFSAFAFKFIEVFGWAKVCSILGALSGFMMVLIGQFGLIFQRNHEEVKAIRKQSQNPQELQPDLSQDLKEAI